MSGYMNNFTVDAGGKQLFQPRINVHKSNYSQFQKGQMKQGAGSSSGNVAPPGGPDSRQQSVERLAGSQAESMSVLSSDAFGQIYQTQ